MMKVEVTANNFRHSLNKYLDKAETAPVIVKKSGRAKSVLISYAMYNKFLGYENDYLRNKINKIKEDFSDPVQQLEKITGKYLAITDEAEISIKSIYNQREYDNERSFVFN